MLSKINKFFAVSVTGISLNLGSCLADDPGKVAGDVVNAFSASCSSAGKWSQQAEAQTQTLISILEKLKKVDACGNVANVLTDMTTAAGQIHGVYGDPNYMNYRQKEETLQELTLAMSSTQEPGLKSTLASYVAQAQADLASARAKEALTDVADNKIGYQDKFSLTTQTLGSDFAKLFNNTKDLSACMQQSPSEIVSVFATLAAIGGSFASPTLGTNMQLIAGMLNTFIGYMRTAHINKAIWKLYDAQMPQAITCGLESMTQFYCQAEDASEIVMREASSYPQPGTQPDNLWRGIDLLTRRLPVLNDWLAKVRAGIEPQNADDGSRIQKVLEKRAQLDSTNSLIIGILNDGKNKYNHATDEKVRLSIKVSTIADLALELTCGGAHSPGHSECGSPFNEYEGNEYIFACKLVEGPDFKCVPPNGNNIDLKTYISGLENINTVTLDDVRTITWPQALRLVTERVMAEFNDIIFIDPSLLIAKAKEHSANAVSPVDTLYQIKAFLSDFYASSQKLGQVQRLTVISQTIAIVDSAIQTIEDYINNPNDVTVNPLITVFDLFRLDFGTQYFGGRLSEFVTDDLVDKLDAGLIPKDLEEVLRSANDEIIHRLTASGFQDLFVLKRDLDRARELSISNYGVFRDFMINAAAKALKDLQKKSVDSGEKLSDGPYRTYGQSVAHLCLLLYATGDKWPSGTENICQNAVLFSVYPDPSGTRKLVIRDLPTQLEKYNNDQLLKNRRRRCAYYDFLRAERLYEVVNPHPQTNMELMSVPGRRDATEDLFNQLIY